LERVFSKVFFPGSDPPLSQEVSSSLFFWRNGTVPLTANCNSCFPSMLLFFRSDLYESNKLLETWRNCLPCEVHKAPLKVYTLFYIHPIRTAYGSIISGLLHTVAWPIVPCIGRSWLATSCTCQSWPSLSL
jgi:hypothetical protein